MVSGSRERTQNAFFHVRILLEHGVPVGDVGELVGDTERVLIRYYSRWMPLGIRPGTPNAHPSRSLR